MYNRGYNSDYRYRLQKLAAAKGNLKLKLQHSKRNDSKVKKKHDNLSINNDNIINRKINLIHYNNLIYNKKIVEKSYSKDNKFQKYINSRSKILSISSNINEKKNYNNYFTNDNINIKNNNERINVSNNENIDNSYILITLNSNNPYNNRNITNISEEKEELSSENERKEYENEVNRKSTSVDVKYNIIVNKIIHNNNNTINNSINNNISNNNKNIKNNSSIKEKMKEQNKNRVIKTNNRDLSAKQRHENYNSNKKINIKDKYYSNFDNKNYSPLLDSNKAKYCSKINSSINNSININESNNTQNNLQYFSNNTQKVKNTLSNINTITFGNSYITNYNNNSNIINHLYTNPNEDEFFDYSNNKNQELTNDEKIIYGERIMKGYIKQKLLGKGGCGIVWLCTKVDSQHFNENKNNSNFNVKTNININDTIENDEYAVKQTSKKNGNALMNFADENVITAKNEIKILCKLNNENNNNCIPKIYDYYEDNNDIWFSFEKGGISISGLSFKIKGEFEKGERIYFIQKGKFLMSLFSTISQFKYLLKSLLSGIDYINKKGIIHSDIKPENILIEYEGDSNLNNFIITSIKIIDYGSAFYVNDTSSISSNTPEYLCPEITILNKKFIKELKNNNSKYVNCIDIWSLGITILELCLCCPIWMSYKAKIIINRKIYHTSGLFGCRGRDANKIYQKQIELTKTINKKLKNSMLYLFEKNERDNFIDLLKKMLEFDYKKRITCQEAMNHPFLND